MLIPSFTLGFHTSGKASQWHLPRALINEQFVAEHYDFKGLKIPSGKFSLGNWTQKNPVTLQEAFGFSKGTFNFPKLSAQLPQQVANSSPQTAPNTPPPGGTASETDGNNPAAQFVPNQVLAQKMVAAVGWTAQNGQWQAFNNIVMKESGYDPTAENPSGAYGIPQALPGTKMSSAGPDWQTDPATQITWMIGYIQSRYGNATNAWSFHQTHGWY